MAASSLGIRAGRAFVELFADPSKMYRVLDAAKRRFEQFSATLAKIGAGSAALGAAFLAPISKVFTDAVSMGADIDAIAKRFHSTAESISVLRGAFAQAGVSGEQFGGVLNGLAEKIAAAADSNSELIDGLQGLRGRDLLGMGLDSQLDAIAEKFRTIVAAEDQIRVASGLGLLPLIEYLKRGKAGMDELRRAAIANGDAMNGEDAKAATAIMREFNRVQLAVTSTLIGVGKALLPAGKDFAAVGADIRTALASAREWIAQNKRLITAVALGAIALTGGGVAMMGFSAAIRVALPIIAAAKLAVGAFAAVVSFATSGPIGMFATALVGLGILWARNTDEGAVFTRSLVDGFKNIASTAETAFGGIMAAMQSGDWKAAGEIMMAALELAWEQGLNAMSRAWEVFRKSTIGSYVEALITGIKAIIDAASALPPLDSGVRIGGGGAAGGAGGAGAANNGGPNFWEKMVIGAGSLWEGITTGSLQKMRDYTNQMRDAVIDENKARVAGADQLQKAEQERLRKLKERLDELVNKQKWESIFRAAGEAMLRAGRGAALDNVGPPRKGAQLPTSAWLAESAKGLFNSFNAQQQLGYGDNVGRRQLDEAVKANDELGKANEKLAKIEEKVGQNGDVYT